MHQALGQFLAPSKKQETLSFLLSSSLISSSLFLSCHLLFSDSHCVVRCLEVLGTIINILATMAPASTLWSLITGPSSLLCLLFLFRVFASAVLSAWNALPPS